jgi:hypothetical protein
MKNKTFTTMGAVHPVLFFVVIYAVALLFSIFICSSLFYSCKSNSKVAVEQKISVQKNAATTPAVVVVMR